MQKKSYTAPTLTVETFRSERGYAESGLLPSSLFLQLLFSSSGGPKGTESEVFSSHGSWNEGSGFWD